MVGENNRIRQEVMFTALTVKDRIDPRLLAPAVDASKLKRKVVKTTADTAKTMEGATGTCLTRHRVTVWSSGPTTSSPTAADRNISFTAMACRLYRFSSMPALCEASPSSGRPVAAA